METTPFCKKQSQLSRYFLALILILAGIIKLSENYIDPVWISAIFSWPMLMITLGVFFLLRRSFIAGTIVGLVGLYFWLPLSGWFENYPLHSIWPIALIIGGILTLLSPRRFRNPQIKMNHINCTSSNTSTNDGMFYANNSFGEVKQTVTDEIFKGADIKNSFGSVELDLRRCQLGEGETIINIECSFGGIEIYAPASWNIRVELQPFMAGYEDSRLKGIPTDTSRAVVIRGNLSFSGLDIKG